MLYQFVVNEAEVLSSEETPPDQGQRVSGSLQFVI